MPSACPKSDSHRNCSASSGRPLRPRAAFSRFTSYVSRHAFGNARELAGLSDYVFSQLLASRGIARHYFREGLLDDLDDAELSPRAAARCDEERFAARIEPDDSSCCKL